MGLLNSSMALLAHLLVQRSKNGHTFSLGRTVHQRTLYSVRSAHRRYVSRVLHRLIKHSEVKSRVSGDFLALAFLRFFFLLPSTYGVLRMDKDRAKY